MGVLSHFLDGLRYYLPFSNEEKNDLVNCLLLLKKKEEDGRVTLALPLLGKEGRQSWPLVVTGPWWSAGVGVQEAKTGDSLFSQTLPPLSAQQKAEAKSLSLPV